MHDVKTGQLTQTSGMTVEYTWRWLWRWLCLSLVSLLCAQSQVSAQADGWRVIGAGLGRTGTDSMKKALGLLGLGDIYHMKDLLRGHPCTLNHMQQVWAPLARGRGEYNATEIRKSLACFGGGVDYPVSPFFRELMDIYPTAKVLLTTRSSKRWALSARSTICPAALIRGAEFNMSTPFQVPWHVRVLRLFLPQAPGTDTALYKKMMAAVVTKIEYPYRTFLQEKTKSLHALSGDATLSDVLTPDLFLQPQPVVEEAHTEVYCRGTVTEMMALYDAWEWYVKSVVPPHRLIVFEIGKDSWEQLAAALNVSVPLMDASRPHDPLTNPSVPFPYVNTMGDYYTMMMGQRLLATLLIVSVGLSVSLTLVVLWYFCCRRRRRNIDAEFYRNMYLHEGEDVGDDTENINTGDTYGGSATDAGVRRQKED